MQENFGHCSWRFTICWSNFAIMLGHLFGTWARRSKIGRGFICQINIFISVTRNNDSMDSCARWWSIGWAFKRFWWIGCRKSTTQFFRSSFDLDLTALSISKRFFHINLIVSFLVYCCDFFLSLKWHENCKLYILYLFNCFQTDRIVQMKLKYLLF